MYTFPLAKQLASGRWQLRSNLKRHMGGISSRTYVSIGTPNVVTGLCHKTEKIEYRGQILNIAQIDMEIYEDGHTYLSLNNSEKAFTHTLKNPPKLIENKIKIGQSILLHFKNSAQASRVYKSFKIEDNL